MPSRRDVDVVLLMKQGKKTILTLSKNNEAKVIMWVLSRKSVGGVRFKKWISFFHNSVNSYVFIDLSNKFMT